jgi:cyclase
MNRPANPFAPRDYGRLERVTDRVHIWRNIVNSGVFVGDRGIAVVDTQVNQALARRLREHLERTFAKPILYAINTHYHWDHTNGNAVFKAAGATLVASRRTARAMVERAPRQKGFLSSRGFELGPDPLQPDAFVEDLPRIDLGGLSLELSLGRDAETSDPTLVWSPEAKVLAAGDTVMTGSFPIFGQPSQREGLEDDGWLRALDEVRGFAGAAVVPGHGPIARAEELAMLERICRYFLEQVAAQRARGHDLPTTIRLMEDEMPAWITRIPVVWGTPRYAILRVWAGLEDLGEPGFQHRKPSAIPRAEAAAAAARPDGDEAGRWRAKALQLLEGGDAAAAVSLAEAAAERFPDDPAIHTALAQILIGASRGVESVLEKGDCFAAARAALSRALELRPGYGPALLQEGQFFVMMAFRNGDDPGRGEGLLERAGADPGLDARQRAEVAFYRGIAERARGDEIAAKRRFAEALAADAAYRPALLAAMG